MYHLVIIVTSNEQICVAISNFLAIRYFTIQLQLFDCQAVQFEASLIIIMSLYGISYTVFSWRELSGFLFNNSLFYRFQLVEEKSICGQTVTTWKLVK